MEYLFDETKMTESEYDSLMSIVDAGNRFFRVPLGGAMWWLEQYVSDNAFSGQYDDAP